MALHAELAEKKYKPSGMDNNVVFVFGDRPPGTDEAENGPVSSQPQTARRGQGQLSSSQSRKRPAARAFEDSISPAVSTRLTTEHRIHPSNVRDGVAHILVEVPVGMRAGYARIEWLHE